MQSETSADHLSSDEALMYPVGDAQVSSRRVVIIGNGPVGMRVAEYLSAQPGTHVVLLGNEPYEAYDRVQLSALLAGQKSPRDITHGGYRNNAHRVSIRCAHVVAVDRKQQQVVDRSGQAYGYDQLVIATGSKPAIPSIPGVHLPGVYAFRDMSDVLRLLARRVRSRHSIVLGGGLLGVEAARGMAVFGTEVTLIEHNSHLLFNQIDARSSALLEDELRSRNVAVRTGCRMRMALGTQTLEGVSLSDGTDLECDTLVIATGIAPNIQLARDAGIAVGRGITVDGQMRTSDPNIYAVGECSEFQQRVHGVVAPGYEQARIVADAIEGGDRLFSNPVLSTSLKVVDLSVASVGEANVDDLACKQLTYKARGVYRRVNVRHGRVVGALAVGDWPDLMVLKDLISRKKRLSPLERLRFAVDGSFWRPGQLAVSALPDSAVVCNCNSVSKGQICAAMSSGADTPAALERSTKAGSTCGSCRPALQELTNSHEPEPVRFASSLLWLSAIALVLVAAAMFAPSLPYAQSAMPIWHWDVLWSNPLYKQASGFTLLGILLMAACLSLRKRSSWVTAGGYDGWRLAHLIFGVLCLVGLLVHTGFRFGSNLNFYLMATVSALTLAGLLLGGLIALEHRLPVAAAQQLRRWGLLAHLTLTWPIPALLTFHVFKTYYF